MYRPAPIRADFCPRLSMRRIYRDDFPFGGDSVRVDYPHADRGSFPKDDLDAIVQASLVQERRQLNRRTIFFHINRRRPYVARAGLKQTRGRIFVDLRIEIVDVGLDDYFFFASSAPPSTVPMYIRSAFGSESSQVPAP